jgi:hypothetical protein
MVVTPPPGERVLRGNAGSLYAPSSFGVDHTTFGPEFDPREHFDSDRYRELDFRQQYPRCTRHDGKMYDFQGRVTRSGPYSATQPFIGSSMPATYVPLDQRRPSSPYRLARLIVRSFTNLVFGEGRFPRVTSDDPETEEFVEALRVAMLADVRFLQARNLGGGVGTVGVSWRYWEGQPRVRVHNGKHLIVHAWADREACEVEHASQLTQTSRVEWDPVKKKRVRRFFWQRRDWTPDADVQFVDAPADLDPGEPVEWIVDEAGTCVHGDGFAHLVWIRNGADDDDGENVDGQCDHDGLFEALDTIDTLKSVLSTGTVKNLDPSLVLKMGEVARQKAAGGVRKGSGTAIDVGESGDAKYLELSGTAVTAGLALLAQERAQVLETAQCVVPSTAELTTAGTSSVAQKALFWPMLSAANVHRSTYGAGYLSLLGQMLRSARRRYPAEDVLTGETVYPVETTAPVEGDDEGTEAEVDLYLDLPPRMVEEDVLDANGQPTGETTTREVQLRPGKGRLTLVWPPYFLPTAADLQTTAQAVSTAAGGKPLLSQQTAVERVSAAVDVDPKREWERVTAEQRAAVQAEQGMFAHGTGGQVGAQGELPPGAEPSVSAGVAIAKLRMAGDLASSINTVNELRARSGDGPLLRPDGTPDPNGDLPLPAFLALLQAAGTASGEGGKGVPGLAAAPPGTPGETSPGKGAPGAGAG